MPQSYRIDRNKRLVIVTAWGCCTLDDALGLREKLLNDRNFDRRYGQLADFTRVTEFEITPQELRLLAEVSPFSFDSRRALVAKQPLVFAFLRMFESFRELKGEKHIRVFHNRREAMTWLMAQKEAAPLTSTQV
jgi:hypothetical protein